MYPHFLMTDPGHFNVSYQINPWMNPAAWSEAQSEAARTGWASLKAALEAAGATIDVIPAVEGLPDLVFPANAAIVLNGKALLARFRHPERQGEQAPFRDAFLRLKARGLISEIVELPDDLDHEGAGDGLWDETRRLFWVGHGQRSHGAAADVIADTFGHPAISLELSSPRFYHLDTCFRPLTGGAVLYYPPAFTQDSLAAVEANVASADRIIATDEDAAALCVNAVCIGSTVIMAKAPDSLRRRLQDHGFTVVEVNLSPFIASGGAAFCMTLRLDLTSQSARAAA